MTRHEAWVHFAAAALVAATRDAFVDAPQRSARAADVLLAEMDERFISNGDGEYDYYPPEGDEGPRTR